MSVTIKRKLLEGRPHLVVPIVLGVVGVWNGSQGPLYYGADELSASAIHWNGRPVVVFHPGMTSIGCAGAPEVFDQQRVGTLFNARFDPLSKALKAEAWLDPARLEAVDPRILAAVSAGRMMEVSTGLFTSNDPASGSYRGQEFYAIARDHRPDHLAILPDEVGACSIADGAGLCRNSGRLGSADVLPVLETALAMPSLF